MPKASFNIDMADDKVWTVYLTGEKVKEYYGADADGRRGEWRTYVDNIEIDVIKDENDQPVELTKELEERINAYIEDEPIEWDAEEEPDPDFMNDCKRDRELDKEAE